MNITENTSEFVSWLIQEHQYSLKAARDVVSRCRRAENILSAQDYADVDLYLLRLNQENAFKELSVSVRSQIRRAIKLQAAHKQSVSSN